jgi:hypothetical protein
MDYPGDIVSLSRLWSVGAILGGVRGILQPRDVEIEDGRVVGVKCEPIHGSLSSMLDVVTDESRESLAQDLISAMNGIRRCGLAHTSLSPNTIWVRRDPLCLLVGGLDRCVAQTKENSRWTLQGMVILLHTLKYNVPSIGVSAIVDSPRPEVIYTHPVLSESIMKEVYAELSKTIAIFAPERRREITKRCYTIFYSAMLNKDIKIEEAKKCVLFSIFLSLSISGVKVDSMPLPDGICDEEWYTKFSMGNM